MAGHLDGRRVVVTGAPGFIGSHLTEALVTAGARVRALARYNGGNHWGHLEELPASVLSQVEVVLGDVLDPFFVDRLIKDAEVVFHLAALIPIPYSYVAPAQFVQTNVMGTLYVLEAVRRHGVARLVHTSTSEVYGSARYTPIDERHPLQAQSPYAASKIGADALVQSYHRAFQVPAVTVRPFNTFGPRQSARAFVPSVVAQALSADVVRVGSLEPVRDMNYVEDTVAGFVRAATAPGVEGLALNLGSGRGVKMRELLDEILRLCERRVEVRVDEQRLRPAASEVAALVCDATLAREHLGWSSRVKLEDGLRRTVAWVAQHLSEYKPHVNNL
jgi:NAD dependent epimerase/dehydratase